MEMNEFVPIISGLLLGTVFGRLGARLCGPGVCVLALLVGTLVPFLNGEIRISLWYLPLDILLASISMLTGLSASRWLGIRLRIRMPAKRLNLVIE